VVSDAVLQSTIKLLTALSDRAKYDPKERARVTDELQKYLVIMGSNHPKAAEALKFTGSVSTQNVLDEAKKAMIVQANEFADVLAQRQKEAVAAAGPEFDKWLQTANLPTFDAKYACR
jgi:hypothetical protein